MSLAWLLLASLTVLGSLVYNIGVKMGGSRIDAFLFTVILTSVAMVGHLVCLGIYKAWFHPEKLTYNTTGLWLAVFAGLGVVMIDLAYFFAVKQGGAVASQAFWTVGGILALTVVAILFLGETLTPLKALGIGFGILSLGLVMKG